MNYSIYDDYKNLEAGEAVAIVPVKGFNISKKYTVGEMNIYPINTVNRKEFKEGQVNFEFDNVSGDFFSSALIAFPINHTLQNMLGSLMPSENDRLMKNVLSKAEDIINIFRYIYSNFDKTSNLPQRAGYINGVLSGVLVCYPQIKKYTYISEKYQTSNFSLSKGLSIDVTQDFDKYLCVLKSECGEVGNILRHAFRIYSDILYMPSVTNKFMQAMSLIEYLANPFEYEQMKKAKTKIIPYSVDSKPKYYEICERFKVLTSLKDKDGKEIGLRTSIVHNGKDLNDLVKEGYEIDLLLRELQSYICNFINNIIIYYKEDWNLVEQKIKEKLEEIEKIKTGYDGKVEADVAILIDFEFINNAIKEIYQLYPNHSNKKFNLAYFLLLVLKQADIKREGYQIPIQFIYKNDIKIYNGSENKKVSELEGLGFDSGFGEISIYTLQAEKEYQKLLEEIFKTYLVEQNYNINNTTKFTNLVLISDRNKIDDSIFIGLKESCKKVILGRLDNKRTTCYDDCKWFDVQYLIMICLGIDIYEECTGNNFIFNVENGIYEK
nr:hypothetical protein [Clostridium paraputrificum]